MTIKDASQAVGDIMQEIIEVEIGFGVNYVIVTGSVEDKAWEGLNAIWPVSARLPPQVHVTVCVGDLQPNARYRFNLTYF